VGGLGARRPARPALRARRLRVVDLGDQGRARLREDAGRGAVDHRADRGGGRRQREKRPEQCRERWSARRGAAAHRARRRDDRGCPPGHGRGAQRAARGRRALGQRMAPQPGPLALSHRGRGRAVLGHDPALAARPRASLRLVRRAGQVGQAAGDLGHAPARAAAGRASARGGDHHARAARPCGRSWTIRRPSSPAARRPPTRTCRPATSSASRGFMPGRGSGGRSWTASCWPTRPARCGRWS
jgi:hypothetical protein